MINPRADSECEQNSEFSATLFENVRERRDDLCFPDAPLIAHVLNAFIHYKRSADFYVVKNHIPTEWKN